MSSPIADLSYRNYDGPLAPPVTRWWPIAVASMRQGIKKKGFWAWSVLSAYGYFLQIIIYYFIDVTFPMQQLVGGKNPILNGIVWHDTFVVGFSISQLLLLVIALQIGTPTIANDNRANALLVYLSRPCTKFDYLFGKWLGIFIPIALIVLVQTLGYYAYGAMSLGTYGFISKDPTLILRLVPMCLVPAFLHASVAIGISSLFNQGRLAGATYAALYFISLFFTLMVEGIYQSQGGAAPSLLRNLFYCSIDGVNIGLAKLIVGTDGSSLIQNQNSSFHAVIPRPDWMFMLLIYFGLAALGLWTAWQRIKPVQVVGS
jgi:ABC-2 type transport system permease protein